MKKSNTPNPLKYFNDEKAKRVAKLTKAQNGKQTYDEEVKELKDKGYQVDNKRAAEYQYTQNFKRGPEDTLKHDYWFDKSSNLVVTSKKPVQKSKKKK